MPRRNPNFFEQQRVGRGNPSYETIARALEREWGVVVTGQTVGNYHHEVIAKPRLDIIQALMGYYELAIADLPDDLRVRIERLLEGLLAAAGNHPSGAGTQRAVPDPEGIEIISRREAASRRRIAHAA